LQSFVSLPLPRIKKFLLFIIYTVITVCFIKIFKYLIIKYIFFFSSNIFIGFIVSIFLTLILLGLRYKSKNNDSFLYRFIYAPYFFGLLIAIQIDHPDLIYEATIYFAGFFELFVVILRNLTEPQKIFFYLTDLCKEFSKFKYMGPEIINEKAFKETSSKPSVNFCLSTQANTNINLNPPQQVNNNINLNPPQEVNNNRPPQMALSHILNTNRDVVDANHQPILDSNGHPIILRSDGN
jgi:hypothetical protein